jgi:hypothetical protein
MMGQAKPECSVSAAMPSNRQAGNAEGGTNLSPSPQVGLLVARILVPLGTVVA